VAGVKAGNASSLVLRPVTRARVAVLAALACAVAAPAAPAASPGPDPSPLGGTMQPDPFPAVSRAPAAEAPTTAPGTTIRIPPVEPAAPVTRYTVRAATRAGRASTHHARGVHAHVARKQAPLTPPTAPMRIYFDDPVLRMTTGFVASAVDRPPKVSKTLALALGLLVLFSAAFVGVAAREMAQ
jgi:hypothetical protein